MVSTMAENDSKKCGLNLIDAVDSFVLSLSVLLVGVCGLLISYSIDQLVIGIVVCIGLLILIGLLWLIYFCKSNCNSSTGKHFFSVIIICIRLWCSGVLGLMSFVDISDIRNDWKTAITWMLVASIIIKAVWSFMQRCLGLIKYSPSLVTWAEVLELVGFSVTGLLVILPEDKTLFSKYAFCLILVSFVVIIVAVRLVACNPFAIFILFAVLFCQGVFFITVDVPFFDAALGCFAGRLFMDPFSDLFSRNISINERLNCVFLSKPGCLQKVFILIVIVFESVFLFHAGVFDIYHQEWYWIMIFVLLLLLWICYHSYSIHLYWKLSNKISECTKAHKTLKGKASMEKMMAAKGMRLQAQFAHCLAFYTFASTVLLGVVTLLIPDGEQPWHKDEKAAVAASFLIVFLVEGMFYAATDTLRKSLPGTCTACVIMPPSTSHRQSELNELRRSIMDFFDLNAIPCSIESFVDGLSIQTLEGKLKGFFAQTTDTSQRRYDSYVVFYCGDVDSDGKWELTRGKFKFENMQRLWNICNTEGLQSRLILIQDAKHSKNWLKKIANDENNVVAMQTCKLGQSIDPETGFVPRVGDFTRDWIEFNSSTENSINWKETGRKGKAVYKVSPPWSDNEFRVPSEEDMTKFTSKFPVKLQCLIKIVLELAEFKEKTHCPPCWKRFTMRWFPPPFIDTGHGFKLVKS